MVKKFKVLRFIGLVWKILAWIVLVVGILTAIGALLTSIFGGGMLSQFAQQQGQWAPWMFGALGGVLLFVATLIGTVIQFLMLYAVGELIFLLLAIEENTRVAARLP
ncbi:MAG: hypothetical protein GX620_17495 [Chloroflexi bacterium]|nr:hypothetical protein [Chloroflexota bacterium]